MTANRLDNFFWKRKKRKEKGNLPGQKQATIRPEKAAQLCAECGLMLINLWPFTEAVISSSVPERWGKTDRCWKRAAFPPDWFSSRFCRIKNAEHYFRGTLYNCTKQEAPLRCGSLCFICRCSRVAAHQFLLGYFYECEDEENSFC